MKITFLFAQKFDTLRFLWYNEDIDEGDISMRKKKPTFSKVITKPVEEITETKAVEIKKPVAIVIKKPEKKIINAVSVVVLNNRSEDAKILLEQLAYQKTKYYPETEIITVEEDNANLLKLTKGEFIAYIKEPKTIVNDFLHQLYVNMRNGKDSCEVNGISCVNRKLLK